MPLKYAWALVAVAVVGALIWAVTYYNGFNRLSNFVSSMRSPAGQSLEAPEQGPVTYVPASTTVVTTPGFETDDSTPAATVTAITPTSITVRISDTETKSFAISGQTPVYSTVLVGQTGKSLADVAAGSKMVVFWDAEDPSAASSLSFSRDEALSLTQDDNTRIVSGKIQGLTNSEVVIAPFDAALPPVVITVDSATQIAATVTAGQTAQPLVEGSIVVARGVSSADGITKAKAIVVAPPLP